MSEKNNGQITTLQQPTTDDREKWKAYWKQQGQPWRTEPEIDTKRQEYLDEGCGVIADIKQGIYPFKDVELSRADIEWLLAVFLDERGTIDWEEEYGLDLRGALLLKVDLRRLPLRGMRCGLTEKEWTDLN